MSDSSTFEAVEEEYVLSKAYVPEHIPSLMTTVSKAAPFLIDDYLGYTKDNWLIFVGYPLETQFDPETCYERLTQALDLHNPEYLWFIGPKNLPFISKPSQVRQSDQYLLLDLLSLQIKSSLQREVRQASRELNVDLTRGLFTREHQKLVDELERRAKLPPMIAELYKSMPAYIAQCESALLLNARDTQGSLVAFFILECAAKNFDTYVLGCHSKENYISHASDLLFSEMIRYTREHGKNEINLGLGVNSGIRRFKTKWGGQPYLDYEFCEYYFGPPKQISILEALLGENG